MARADLLVELVKFAIKGNKPMIKKVVEAIVAEEREKQHTILAERLQKEIHYISNDIALNQPSTGSNRFIDMSAENFIL